ncbi:uncharacterized protein LOC110430744 isoform X1 [Sorghum bicolor]|uniref:Uncharacterized protein n=1 Tax=Sorghum bicolor TaxID=4558 RepID=A0A194YJM9_SORBI|nr:uncharacterized protein LOC110430744 isoform X1 [Sorghum bicolor]KXG19806.1 hypothetical protein SORBI_3010G119400 [Sorghum bicolor]|eukprot:XP_021304307.1 uncharacterized protein LOC110430744 isoform X1 [Sorghum bicolor]
MPPPPRRPRRSRLIPPMTKKRKGKSLPGHAPATEAPIAKRKEKGLPHPVPASEVPVTKKPKTGDASTSTTKLPISGVAVVAATHTAVQTFASASSTLSYGRMGCRPRGPCCPYSKTGMPTAKRHSSKHFRLCRDAESCGFSWSFCFLLESCSSDL